MRPLFQTRGVEEIAFRAILHPSSSILHPSPSILHPSSSILHYLSFIIYPSPSILHHLSSILHRLSSILHHLSFIIYPPSFSRIMRTNYLIEFFTFKIKHLDISNSQNDYVFQSFIQSNSPYIHFFLCNLTVRVVESLTVSSFRRSLHLLSFHLTAKTTNLGPGSIAHHGSKKCIHLNPANRLVVRTGCYRSE